MFGRLFLDHPHSVHESYPAHFRAALGFAVLMFRCSLAAMIHALVPCLFQKTASRTVARLYDRMIVNRISTEGGNYCKLPTIRDRKTPCDGTSQKVI